MVAELWGNKHTNPSPPWGAGFQGPGCAWRWLYLAGISQSPAHTQGKAIVLFMLSFVRVFELPLVCPVTQDLFSLGESPRGIKPQTIRSPGSLRHSKSGKGDSSEGRSQEYIMHCCNGLFLKYLLYYVFSWWGRGVKEELCFILGDHSQAGHFVGNLLLKSWVLCIVF